MRSRDGSWHAGGDRGSRSLNFWFLFTDHGHNFSLEDMKTIYTSFSRVLSKDGIQLTPISLNCCRKTRENKAKQQCTSSNRFPHYTWLKVKFCLLQNFEGDFLCFLNLVSFSRLWSNSLSKPLECFFHMQVFPDFLIWQSPSKKAMYQLDSGKNI